MQKILITHNDIKFIGYLLEDKETKFVALNESKVVTWHYPKASYSYKIVEPK
tara:strand:- start:474 stop:629 length:156 start_codon:yes stop_codon:yes gene_type:complete